LPLKEPTGIQNKFPEGDIFGSDRKFVETCARVALEWILQNFRPSFKIDSTNKIIDYMLELLHGLEQNNTKTRRDIKFYAYFLYFSGILYLLKDRHTDLTRIKIFIIKEIENESDRISKQFYKFLTIYIDIVDQEVKDIAIISRLENCLKEDEFFNNVVLNAICQDVKIGVETVQNRIGLESRLSLEEKIKRIFPNMGGEYLQTNSINIIESFYTGLGRIYFLIGDLKKQENVLNEKILNNFAHNPFAVVQRGYLYLNKFSNDTNSEENYLNKAKDAFISGLELVTEKNQFTVTDPFKYDIKIEALLGLAYIEYLKGNGSNADKKYQDIEQIINSDVMQKEKKNYLLSILKLNQARNMIDNKIIKDETNIQKIHDEIFKIYDESDSHLQEILTRTVSYAYNNLGIYYLSQALYEEAEGQFKKSLLINDFIPHARYNLGALCYKKGEYDRALILIKNALFIDPKFNEAKKALSKIDSGRKGLGSEWLDWWFGDKEKEHKTQIKKIVSKNLSKICLFFLVISLLMMTIGALIYHLYFHSIIGLLLPANAITGLEVDENAFLVIIGICFAIILLPLISKLKVGDIELELELESKGSKLVTLALISSGLFEEEDSEIKSRYFLPPFWYWDNDLINMR